MIRGNVTFSRHCQGVTSTSLVFYCCVTLEPSPVPTAAKLSTNVYGRLAKEKRGLGSFAGTFRVHN